MSVSEEPASLVSGDLVDLYQAGLPLPWAASPPSCRVEWTSEQGTLAVDAVPSPDGESSECGAGLHVGAFHWLAAGSTVHWS